MLDRLYTKFDALAALHDVHKASLSFPLLLLPSLLPSLLSLSLSSLTHSFSLPPSCPPSYSLLPSHLLLWLARLLLPTHTVETP
jgi:hypothetical protein